MTATKTSPKLIACECYKCGGSGYIPAFSGIANGVCFTCNGEGKVYLKAERKPKPIKPATAYQVEQAEKILNATDDQFSTMGYGELLKLRDFAHWPIKQYPQILKVWREKGESYFQVQQEIRWQEWRSNQ
jgi:hypothetical protein